MSKVTSMTRTGFLAVLMALVGFSYALATNNSDAVTDVATRAAGTVVGSFAPLAFANPFVTGSTDRDLGDAVSGSAVTRLVRAKGGVAPYSFTAGSTPTGLSLLTNGILTGTLGSYSPSALRFLVTVKDSFGTHPDSVTNTFRLTVINSTTFRFGNSALSDGTQFQSYSDNLIALNGKTPYTFAVSGVTLKGVAQANGLRDVGLSLSNDGVIYGVPILPGTISFVATATDAAGKTAVGRNGTGLSQTFSFTVAASTIVQGSFLATAITVKEGLTGKDSVSLKGVLNLGAETIASLSGKPLTVRIGAFEVNGPAFDGKGNSKSAAKVTPAIKASVKKYGVFAFSDMKDSINVGTLPSGATFVNLAVEVRVGDAVVASQFLHFNIKTGKGTAATLTYKLGGGNDLGGTISLLKVTGADDKAGTGDAFKVAFGGVPPASVVLTTTNFVSTIVGNLNLGATGALTNKGKITFKGAKNSANVVSFSYDTIHGKGGYTTGILPATGTGLPQASKGGSEFYSHSVTFLFGTTTLLSAQGGLNIVPKGIKYASQ
jgi:hypothetical protein